MDPSTPHTRADETRRLLAAVVESSDDAILTKTPDGFITSWNRGAERLYGYTAAEVLGRPVTMLVPEGQRDEVPDIMARLSRGERIDHYETLRRRKNGSVFPVSVTISPLRDDGGRVVGASAIARDITDRRLADAERGRLAASEGARTRVEEAYKELETFSDAVSHDLRAPLRKLAGFSDILLEDYGSLLDARGREMLERIQAASRRMGSLIEGLLELSRVTRAEVRREVVDLAALAREAAEDLRAASPGRAVECLIPATLPVRGDPTLLRGLVMNLLSNAWKFTSTRRAARVELGALAQGSETVYYVRDDGVGFNPSHAGTLFLPFRRLPSAAPFEGTGIGLATAQRIVRRHGGRMWAESAPERGAAFFFTLGEDV